MTMMSDSQTTTVLLCGVGGQGTILAAELLANAALEADQDVKVSEIHGMSQRGGAVTTVVRFGSSVKSMVSDKGAADIIVSFETTEALRNIDQLKVGGTLIVNDVTIEPLPVLSGNTTMPADVYDTLQEVSALLVPAEEIAREAGNAKAANVALLGVLSAHLGFSSDIWEEAVRTHVPPKTIEANLQAFQLGRAFGENGDHKI